MKICSEYLFLSLIQQILSNRVIAKNNKLQRLNPILDARGILRVGGRLDLAKTSHNVEHRIILPNNHHAI